MVSSITKGKTPRRKTSHMHNKHIHSSCNKLNIFWIGSIFWWGTEDSPQNTACWYTEYFKMKESENSRCRKNSDFSKPLKRVTDLKILPPPIYPNKILENARIWKVNLNHLFNHSFLELQVVWQHPISIISKLQLLLLTLLLHNIYTACTLSNMQRLNSCRETTTTKTKKSRLSETQIKQTVVRGKGSEVSEKWEYSR